ncbi:MAG: lysoplasmalogenase [Treponema sp.]|nr:lysoplasmalogenase [Treponema sp.]
MEKLAIIFAIIGIIIQGIFIFSEYKNNLKAAVFLKGSASLMFLLIGYFGYTMVKENFLTSLSQAEIVFARRITLGLLFGLLGDVTLNIRYLVKKLEQKIFLLGIALFLTGHIFYLLALIPQAVNLWLCVIIGTVLAAALLIYICLTIKVKLAFKIFGVVYIGAVMIMTVIALGIAIGNPSAKSIIYAIGAFLFTASDIILIFNTFKDDSKFYLRVVNLALYYLGQLLIAGCLYFI